MSALSADLLRNNQAPASLAVTKPIGLMGHVIADYPSPEAARSIIEVLASQGAKVVEIQIPFSEPMADGPVFLAANQEALAQGVDYKQSMALMREVTARFPAVQFVFMTYLNVVFKRGYKEFIRDAVAAGARGVIIPDLPLDAALDSLATRFARECDAAPFSQVQLIPPNCSPVRMKALCETANGLIYALARTGVTGAKTNFEVNAQGTSDLLLRIRTLTDLPIAVGFGIKSGRDIQFLRGKADLAVVGTQTLTVYKEQGLSGLRRLWQEFASSAA